MEDLEPILFFKDLVKPGMVSIFATLKEAVDLVTKNKKPYLRLVLIDPFSKEQSVQIWDDSDIYAPANMFMRKNLLNFGSVIHLINLTYDGEFVSSSIKTKINVIPTQHPIFQKYHLLNQYRLYRIIPEEPSIIKEIKKLLEIKPLVETILTRLKDEGVPITEELLWEATTLITDKTYTGTIHLITGNPQLTITPQYTNYIMKQLEILLIVFDRELATDRLAPIILLRRLQKDLISLYEYSQLQPNK
ncbi:MAG: hypothetical protein JXA54_14165 [Candidatus Heimdallarchaeota archaeon]|nr:hypothetical protein [Candidatus Heimdallarchaeota archaeon]